ARHARGQLSCRVWECWFFFSSRRRHTRFSRDWSSDVCSSDLVWTAQARVIAPDSPNLQAIALDDPKVFIAVLTWAVYSFAVLARDRKSVVQGKRVAVGGRRKRRRQLEQRGQRGRAHQRTDGHD